MDKHADRSPTKQVTLLIADGSQVNRGQLSSRLEAEGYTVSAAENGLQALDLIRHRKFNLALLNVRLPELDSKQVLENLDAEGRLRRTPVIVFGGVDDIEDIVHCLRAGAEDYLIGPLNAALVNTRIVAALEKKRLRQMELSYLTQIEREKKRSEDLLQVVIPIGIALSAEKDLNRLLEKILLEAKTLCHADAGTLYLRTDDNLLKFVIMRNDSLHMALGGTTGKEIPFRPLRLYDEATGQPNHHNVATHTALSGETVNIPDAYQAEGFDFSGTQAFDRNTGYRSTSFLTLPLKDSLSQVIGVLQLINAQDSGTGQVIPFDHNLHPIVESLASLATVALQAYIREERLRRQIEELRIEIDEGKKARQVAEITETDYFQQLREKARELRASTRGSDPGRPPVDPAG